MPVFCVCILSVWQDRLWCTHSAPEVILAPDCIHASLLCRQARQGLLVVLKDDFMIPYEMDSWPVMLVPAPSLV